MDGTCVFCEVDLTFVYIIYISVSLGRGIKEIYAGHRSFSCVMLLELKKGVVCELCGCVEETKDMQNLVG
jgi:hypothetical protein